MEGAAALISVVVLIPAVGLLDRALAQGNRNTRWAIDSRVGNDKTSDTVNGQTTTDQFLSESSHGTSSDGQENRRDEWNHGSGDGSGQDHTEYGTRWADGSTATFVGDESWDAWPKGNRTRTGTDTATDTNGNRTTTTTEDKWDSNGHLIDHKEKTKKEKVQPPKPPEKVEQPRNPGWVMYVKGSATAVHDGMTSRLTLDIKANNRDGFIDGTYYATGQGSAGIEWSGGGGNLSETFTVTLTDFRFTLSRSFAGLGAGAPKDGNNYLGAGTMTLTTSGQGTGSGFGRSAAVPVKPKASQASFRIEVIGTAVNMTVTDEAGAVYRFYGHVRAEAK